MFQSLQLHLRVAGGINMIEVVSEIVGKISCYLMYDRINCIRINRSVQLSLVRLFMPLSTSFRLYMRCGFKPKTPGLIASTVTDWSYLGSVCIIRKLININSIKDKMICNIISPTCHERHSINTWTITSHCIKWRRHKMQFFEKKNIYSYINDIQIKFRKKE